MPSHTALPGNAMPTAPLDTRYQIETPEGIDLPLRPAGEVSGPSRRSSAP